MKTKVNLTNNQTAFEYAIYMMVGSYFKKTVCNNSLQEQKMRVQYMEQKIQNQYSLEDCCIRFVHKNLLHKCPKNLWNQEMQVHFIPNATTGKTEIRFTNEEYVLRLVGTYAGKKSVIHHELWMKGNQVAA